MLDKLNKNGIVGTHYRSFDNGKEGRTDGDCIGVCYAVNDAPGGSSNGKYPILEWHTP
jgi:hypothetical protein